MEALGTIEFYDAEEKRGSLILDADYMLNPELQLVVGGRLIMGPGAFSEGTYFKQGQRVRCVVEQARSGVLMAKDVRPYIF